MAELQTYPRYLPDFFQKKPIREYNIRAISVKLVYNKQGDYDPNGMLYILKENEQALRDQVAANGLKPSPLAQPLVIRANLGELVKIKFTNKLPFPASIHVQKVSYHIEHSDGAAVGVNEDTTVPPGQTGTFLWHADQLGTCFFGDLGNPRASEAAGSNIHGLWGALIVEEPGSAWTDPETGEPLLSSQLADIHHPVQADFREYVLFMQDEPEIKNAAGLKPTNPMTGQPDSTMAFNYRSEPMRNRHSMDPTKGLFGENVMMSSWVFGDPATPLLRAYRGDPAKIRLLHAGVKETHVFHLHVHQWRLEPKDAGSTIIDSISISPQQTYDIEILGGAGSLHGAIGDAIWHCHLYPHFGMGMWGLWRVHDRLEDGSPERILPDGTSIPALRPLPDRTPPPPPDALHPGYPLFIPGTFGERAPKAPLAITGTKARPPEPLELANFVPNYKPGFLYVNPVPEGAPVKTFNIVAIQRDLVYNKLGWHDPEGRLYVLEEDVNDVITGKKKPEPLFIRANVGDEIVINLRNALPTTLGGNAFQLKHDTISVGTHVHLVKFDAISSDGSANGWNYDNSADTGDIVTTRWFADAELNTCFFHDHLFAALHQQHGIFNALIVEPAGSSYLDPSKGAPIKSGSQAIIKTPGTKPSFREFCLAVHDFALLFDKEGNPLNPPPYPDSEDDPGVMGINYTNEPFKGRVGEPAYVFSSFLHGDPFTPLWRSYSEDPVRIRLIDGAHEEQHCFNLHGVHWRQEIGNPNSPLKNSQTLGLSEAFNLEFAAPPVVEDTDYLYYFGALDDLWLGLWGIFRVFGSAVDDLVTLPDRLTPPARTSPRSVPTGAPPPPVQKAEITPPENRPVKTFEISAIQKKLIYNNFGDHDPLGLIFVPTIDKKRILLGRKKPEPLVIRANLGDYIAITLENALPQTLKTTIKEPEVPVEIPWPASNRVSLAAGLTTFNALASGGIAVGFNPDPTIGPGETITYQWQANVSEGTALLASWGDVRNHRHHGLFGGLIIEPEGSTYKHPGSGRAINAGTMANILCYSRPSFREFVIFIQDGIRLLDKNGNILPDLPFLVGEADEVDFEDQGQKALNYLNEPFHHRLANDPRAWKVFSSFVHGDPVTPVFKAYPDDPVIFRVIMAADKPRNHCLSIHGHHWQAQPGDPSSEFFANQGAISVGNSFDLFIANGQLRTPGDYLYRAGIFFPDLEVGMWGIFRLLSGYSPGLRRLK